jgi:anti-sigma regulatory factor (Ser/Thr protein kinase)
MLAIGLNFQLETASNAPRLARDALAPLADELGDELITDLRLVVSELVANSVIWGPGGLISIGLEIDDDACVRGFVDDGGRFGVQVVDADPIEATGLGLQIVSTLCRDWGVTPNSTRVWFELAAE